jgi:hypothetical protein
VTRNRRVLGWALGAVGVALLVVAIAVAAIVGPDSAVSSGTHRMTSDGVAIVTSDEALDHSGPTVTVTASTADGGPVFVGVGNAVDVRDYLAGSPVTRVDTFSFPWDVTITAVDGKSAPAADPRELDWWLVSGSGDGSASVDFPLPDEVVDVVIMSPDRGRGLVADITVAVELPGLFTGAIAAALFALGLMLAGIAVLRRHPAAS